MLLQPIEGYGDQWLCLDSGDCARNRPAASLLYGLPIDAPQARPR